MSAPRMSALDPGGPQADAIATLWDVFLWVTLVVWLLVVGFVAVGAVVAHRRRVREGEGNPIAKDPAGDRRLTRNVAIAGGVTIATLIGLLIASMFAGRELANLEDDADALHVKITGHQWWWQLDYEPADPRLTATTANELYLPVGRVVHLHLASADVIHSFWAPSLHGKRDLIPGRENRTWLRIDEPGVYRGQCAEFCGLAHAKMVITIIAVPPDQFEAWLQKQREPAKSPVTDDQRRGQEVFMGGPCVLCHTISGTQAGGRLGPDLSHFASRSTIGAGDVPNTVGYLAGWIADPHGLKPGVTMPANTLPSADLHALVAYLRSLE